MNSQGARAHSPLGQIDSPAQTPQRREYKLQIEPALK